MITQILGVALISLLTITPTIQQNNIEQLIAPNIELQDNVFNNTTYSNQVHLVNNFSYYDRVKQLNTTGSNNTSFQNIYTNFSTISLYNDQTGYNQDYTVNTGTYKSGAIYITDNDFYVTFGSIYSITNQAMRDIIQHYYLSRFNTSVTSSSFSFPITTNSLSISSSFYTYTVNGNAGSFSGRIYHTTDQAIDGAITVGVTNSSISIPSNATMQQLINSVQPFQTLESQNTMNTKILYYHLNSPIPTTVGNHTRTLFGVNNYGFTINYGSISINVIPPDTTPPTITGITGNSTNWTNQNITLTVQATDNVGLNATAYSFDNGATYQASNSKTFTTNEIVNIRVRDSSNNVTNQSVTINRIDKQTPAIVLAGNWVNTFELGVLTSNNDLYNYLTISDGASGINSSLTTINNFNYNQAGTYTNVQVSATDNANNTFVNTLPTITITQPLDTTPPTISGSTVQTRVYGTVTTQGLLDSFTVSDPSGIDEIRIQQLDDTIVTSWDDFNVGSYQLRLYARDTLDNIALYQFELLITAPPAPDLTPPVITGSLLLSFPMGTYTSTSEILALYTITDNVEVAIQQLIGTIDFETQGEYQVTISATDTSNNTSTRNVLVRIRSEMSLDGYNPITDLLSGIFGGVLSMIFTIGTINLLGFRLLDAMAIIILGGVIYLVYKAIRK
jgi:hypothetical protein